VIRKAFWLVLPTAPVRPGIRPVQTPIGFSSPEKMTQWVSSREAEDYWYVRLVNPKMLVHVLEELIVKGFTEIQLEGDERFSSPTAISTVLAAIRELQGKDQACASHANP
jgi:hypothetical protein